jgi:hypothetical protein
MAEGRRIVGGLVFFRVARQRERRSFSHQAGRPLSLGGRDEIHGAHLVILAPSIPIRQVRHPLIEDFLGDGGVQLRRNQPHRRQREKKDTFPHKILRMWP